jgi:hypothetical protein
LSKHKPGAAVAVGSDDDSRRAATPASMSTTCPLVLSPASASSSGLGVGPAALRQAKISKVSCMFMVSNSDFAVRELSLQNEQKKELGFANL